LSRRAKETPCAHRNPIGPSSSVGSVAFWVQILDSEGLVQIVDLEYTKNVTLFVTSKGDFGTNQPM